MNYRSTERQAAFSAAGWRERYAMENGNATTVYINGNKCIKYTYSSAAPYQDANGATYDTIKKQWIN